MEDCGKGSDETHGLANAGRPRSVSGKGAIRSLAPGDRGGVGGKGSRPSSSAPVIGDGWADTGGNSTMLDLRNRGGSGEHASGKDCSS